MNSNNDTMSTSSKRKIDSEDAEDAVPRKRLCTGAAPSESSLHPTINDEAAPDDDSDDDTGDYCDCTSSCGLLKSSDPICRRSNFTEATPVLLEMIQKTNKRVYDLRSKDSSKDLKHLYLREERLHGDLIGTSITFGAYGYGYVCGVQLLPRRVTETPLSDEEIFAMIEKAKVGKKEFLENLKKYDDKLEA